MQNSNDINANQSLNNQYTQENSHVSDNQSLNYNNLYPDNSNNSLNHYQDINQFYLYQNSILNFNLDQNMKSLTNCINILTNYNYEKFKKVEEENLSLDRENRRLKRDLCDMDVRLGRFEKKKRQELDNERTNTIDNKKYFYRKNKDSYDNDKIIDLKSKINNLNDIISLETQFREIRHDPDLIRLYYCIDSLKSLQNMVGMDKAKDEIFKHLIYYIKNRENQNMLHTIITGPPGTGKTELGSILAKIYLSVGALKKNIFRVVKRSDLIAGYLGQTAIKTQKIIDECDGGVLFIDEAYSLGNKEQRDSFSKECLDTLNQNLTEKKNSFMCIIAGYPEELEKCFFAYNSGLERRFSFKYNIESYNAKELLQIFDKKINDLQIKIDIEKDWLLKFFEKNYKKLKFFGGDIEKLVFYTKLESSHRCFKDNIETKIIKTDLESSINKWSDIEEDKPPPGIYC